MVGLGSILYRYALHKNISQVSSEENLEIFADAAKVSPYALSAMKWAVGQELIVGMDGKLVPQGKATRAQVATILMRYITK